MEEWKDITGFEGIYQVSNLGRVRRISGTRQGILKPYKHHLRAYIQFKVDGKHKCYDLAKLVAKHFLPCTDEDRYVEHIDGDLFNNAVSNLRWGDATERSYICKLRQRGKNKYRIEGEYAYVTLPNTGNEMICDLEDWEKYKNYTWFENAGYTVMGGNGTNLFHRLVMNTPSNMIIDHINRNRLDNRKQNLRITTYRVNNINRTREITSKTGVYGVTLSKSNKYVVRIRANGKKLYIGSFDTLSEAKEAREKAEIKYHLPIIEKETLQTGCFFNT